MVLTREGHLWTWGQPWPPGDMYGLIISNFDFTEHFHFLLLWSLFIACSDGNILRVLFAESKFLFLYEFKVSIW